MESCRCLASKAASSSHNKSTQLHIEEDGLKSRLYNRPKGQAASFRRPRLLGGDPLASARLVERAALGISDERGYEQDNVSPKSQTHIQYLTEQMELCFTNLFARKHH